MSDGVDETRLLAKWCQPSEHVQPTVRKGIKGRLTSIVARTKTSAKRKPKRPGEKERGMEPPPLTNAPSSQPPAIDQ